MTDAEMIQSLGGVTAVARLLSIKPPSVHSWIAEGIPEPRLIALAGQIELRSGGRFSRRERWPDRYAIFWPELADIGNPISTPPTTEQPATAGAA